MPLGLLGQKVGMTQIYDANGKIAPVTVLAVGPCPILQVRTVERDGYNAVQVGFQDKARKRASRAERGHVATEFSSKRRKSMEAAGVAILPKANCEPQKYLREFRLETASDATVGTILNVEGVFKDITHVDVIGNSKGRGFTGAMKRHNFAGLGASHGTKKMHRSAGSMSSHCSNRGDGRPKSGHKGAGRYGGKRVTSRNLEVVKVDTENNLLLVRGAVPGPNGGFIVVRPTNKKN